MIHPSFFPSPPTNLFTQGCYVMQSHLFDSHYQLLINLASKRIEPFDLLHPVSFISNITIYISSPPPYPNP
ncbi:hypothetical protein EYC80_001261 [Monilinia laxa]|uniref:Uncharacterized protein n=1 Tax=Monilinia laxa TaxID=61186 RepID=A0A5N6K8R3_MONLA|nr:hypothetical protein EYC80_001261 [Monilinia laxa]